MTVFLFNDRTFTFRMEYLLFFIMFVTLLVSRHTSTSEFRRTPDEKDVEGEGKGERF